MEHRPSHQAVTWDPRNTKGPSGDKPRNAQSQAGAVIGSGELVDGRYRLDAVIGAGGMGVVWAATHERLDRKVALKQIPLVRGRPDHAHTACADDALEAVATVDQRT